MPNALTMETLMWMQDLLGLFMKWFALLIYQIGETGILDGGVTSRGW